MRVLIAVKTYPIPSAKYDELVCTAGVTETGDFVRLYPINFRDLPFEQQYRKYQWIDVEVQPHKGRDRRKESFRPNCDSLQIIGDPIKTKNGDWSERAKYVLNQKARSLEELYDRQAQDNTSLGVFRPKSIDDLVIKKDAAEWKPAFSKALAQARLWDSRTVSSQPPRKVPFKFQYRFHCDDSRCKGHQIMIEDWEVGALFWRLRDQGLGAAEAAAAVKKKFLGDLCGADKDTHFLVGTVLAHPKSWVIIGVFYPKRRQPPSSSQPTLFPQ